MSQLENIKYYEKSWDTFRQYCENKAKEADCIINNKGWHKLREYHLENYLQTISTPYGFLFIIKFRYSHIYQQIKCMPKLYHKYARKHREQFDSIGKRMVSYPSWRGFFK